jgi:hypothetical protein
MPPLFYFRFCLLVLTLYYAACVVYLYCIMSNVFVISHVLSDSTFYHSVGWSLSIRSWRRSTIRTIGHGTSRKGR